ncbi:hypothetical protein FIU93_23060 [Labrenzia sp. THAF35]|uniref:hypothetical protein n=1 Tax=Labrenzia sp. THAF35 TaxID=2587854 RepID=UPI0012689029|nr:hypothetical protein [Labrenzia sp. THAF35]QFT69683.1 hypothetical protein FIU93_23060 [Labrenzia sp. THAF35]
MSKEAVSKMRDGLGSVVMKMKDDEAAEPHPDFEVFSDEAYFGMWCLRPIGNRSFDETIHFNMRGDAVNASHVVAAWMKK